MRLSQKEYQELIQRSPAVRNAVLASLSKLSFSQSEAKYHNKKVYVFEDGFISESKSVSGHGKIVMKFDSGREYARYHELRLLEKAGKISDLNRQIPIVIQEAFTYNNEKIRAITYVADFTYTQPDGKKVVEDVKGMDKNGKRVKLTADFKLKWKLLKAKYPELLFLIY